MESIFNLANFFITNSIDEYIRSQKIKKDNASSYNYTEPIIDKQATKRAIIFDLLQWAFTINFHTAPIVNAFINYASFIFKYVQHWTIQNDWGKIVGIFVTCFFFSNPLAIKALKLVGELILTLLICLWKIMIGLLNILTLIFSGTLISFHKSIITIKKLLKSLQSFHSKKFFVPGLNNTLSWSKLAVETTQRRISIGRYKIMFNF